MSTETKDISHLKEPSDWDRVYSAITARWPQIDQLGLLECKQNIQALSRFVHEQTNAAHDEVEAVVSEFAPHADSAIESVIHPIADTAHNAVERVHYEIDEAPVRSTLAGVLFGFSLGVIATTLYSNACRRSLAQRKGWF